MSWAVLALTFHYVLGTVGFAQQWRRKFGTFNRGCFIAGLPGPLAWFIIE